MPGFKHLEIESDQLDRTLKIQIFEKGLKHGFL